MNYELLTILAAILGTGITLGAIINSSINRLDGDIKDSNKRFDAFMLAWKEESKDFHGRLISLEERSRGK